MRNPLLDTCVSDRTAVTIRNATFLVFSLCLCIFSFKYEKGLDPFWHLAIGQEIVSEGLSFFSPLQDTFSFTCQGMEYFSTYIFDCLLAFFVEFFGVRNGFVGLRIFFFMLFSIALWALYRQQKIDWRIAIVLLPIILFFMYNRILTRPELLSFALVVVSLILYQRAAEQFNSKELLSISALLLFWSNYHTPILGYIIFFGLFVDKGILLIRKKANFTWHFWLGWGLILVALGFVNPSMKHFLIETLKFDDFWYSHIIEYTATDPGKIVGYHLTYVLYAILLGFLIYMRRFGYFAVSALLSFYAYNMIRLYSIVGVFNLSILAIVLNDFDIFGRLISAKRTIRMLFSIFLLLLVPTFTWIVVSIIIGIPDGYRHFFQKHPVETVQYLKTQKGGPVFNEYNKGGYLSYAAGNQYPVYIDGRTNILYPVEVMKRYLSSLSDAEVLSREVNKYDIKYALLSNHYGFYSTFKKTGKFNLDFISDQSFLMKTGDANFPKSGDYLFRPACWKQGSIPNEELDRAEILPQNSGLRGVLEVLRDLELKKIKDPKYELSTFDLGNRLMAYVAYHLDRNKEAFFLFSALRGKTYTDLFMMASILIQDKQFDQAEKILYLAVTKEWRQHAQEINRAERFLLFGLLEVIREKQALKLFTGDYVAQLDKQFGKNKYTNINDVSTKLPGIICNMYR